MKVIYKPLVGSVHPLGLRDALLAYLQGRRDQSNEPIWRNFGPVGGRGQGDLKTLWVDGGCYYRSLALALEHLYPLCKHFYPECNERVFDHIREEIQLGYSRSEVLLLWQVAAWLSVDDWRIPQRPHLHYGLVVAYPDVILHFSRCFLGYERSFYERSISAKRWLEINEIVSKHTGVEIRVATDKHWWEFWKS